MAADVLHRIGIDLPAIRRFLQREAFKQAHGFYSQYASVEPISCATTAICAYALSETGPIRAAVKRDYRSLILGFRNRTRERPGVAFPRTPSNDPSVWATAQSVLALTALGADWGEVRESVEWLVEAQGPDGGWSFTGERDQPERLLYSVYPLIVLRTWKRRRSIGASINRCLERAFGFLRGCSESNEAVWQPCLSFLKTIVGGKPPAGRLDGHEFADYADLFAHDWPAMVRVDENQLAHRFSTAYFWPANYLFIRRHLAPDQPLSLLHIRYLADTVLCRQGWNDATENRPKTWTTALAMLALFRWSQDLTKRGDAPRRLPTRIELMEALRRPDGSSPMLTPEARKLLKKLRAVRVGPTDADAFRNVVRDALEYAFSGELAEPKIECKTWLGTQRRDITFRIVAKEGPWHDWKNTYQIPASVVVECKNVKKLGPDDLRQIACYLGDNMGRFGLIVTRKNDADQFREHLNWFMGNDRKCVLLLSDDTVQALVHRKGAGGDPTALLADLHRSLVEGVQ